MTASELTGTTRRAGTTVGSGTETTGARRVYAYDNIGNRDTYTKGTGAQTTYESNQLNQYENVETASSPVTGQNLLYDADGNVIESYVVADFCGVAWAGWAVSTCPCVREARRCRERPIPPAAACEGDPEFDERANLVTGDDPECIDAADQSAFMSLFGLSATSVMRAQMLWDAENRLAAYIPLNQSGGAKKVTFKYDYRGRRVEKNVYAWNSGAGAWYGDAYPTERRRFVWNGWLMLRETIESDLNSDGDLNDQDEGTRVKTYTWGKDLGGGLESAGGIGGLLAVYDDSATSGSTGDDLAYVYMYDANGNVGQVCNLTESTAGDSIVAKYEYDAYGSATISTGSYATANTYRFSTKPWDDETGLGYWGYRYYDPRLGRWMSRDPIGERGGTNVFHFCLNKSISAIDALGERVASCCRVELKAYSLSFFGIKPSHAYLRVEDSCRDNQGVLEIVHFGPRDDYPIWELAPKVDVRFAFGVVPCPIPRWTWKVPVVRRWDLNSPEHDHGSTIKAFSGDASLCDCIRKNAAKDFTDIHVPIGPNSNSAIRELLERCGLDSYLPEGSPWLPGYEVPIE